MTAEAGNSVSHTVLDFKVIVQKCLPCPKSNDLAQSRDQCKRFKNLRKSPIIATEMQIICSYLGEHNFKLRDVLT